MVMKGHSSFPKAPALLKSQHQIISCHIRTFVVGVLPLCRDAVGLFHSPSRLGYLTSRFCWKFPCVDIHSILKLSVFLKDALKETLICILLKIIIFYRCKEIASGFLKKEQNFSRKQDFILSHEPRDWYVLHSIPNGAFRQFHRKKYTLNLFGTFIHVLEYFFAKISICA